MSAGGICGFAWGPGRERAPLLSGGGQDFRGIFAFEVFDEMLPGREFIFSYYTNKRKKIKW